MNNNEYMKEAKASKGEIEVEVMVENIQTNCNNDFISSAYSQMCENIDADFKESKLNCALSLNNSDENQNFFEWSIIGIGNKLFHPYDTLQLKNYMDSFQGRNIPDPLRTQDKLNHVKPRVNRFAELLNKGVCIRKKQITKAVKKDILDRVIKKKSLKDGEECLVNLSDAMQLSNLFFTGIDSVKGEELIKTRNYRYKALVFRNSSTSDSTKDYTIFSATHCQKDLTFSYFRFLDIHGCGIYAIAHLSSETINSLKTAKEFCHFLKWTEPDYAFFLDLVLDLSRDGHSFILNK